LEICAKFFEPCAAAQLTRQPPERGRRLSFSETRRTRADTPARRLIVAGAFVQGADQYKNVDNAQQCAAIRIIQRRAAHHRRTPAGSCAAVDAGPQMRARNDKIVFCSAIINSIFSRTINHLSKLLP
jgi:hypothetical protein